MNSHRGKAAMHTQRTRGVASDEQNPDKHWHVGNYHKFRHDRRENVMSQVSG